MAGYDPGNKPRPGRYKDRSHWFCRDEVLHLLFNESGGLIAHDLARHNHGMLVNGPTWEHGILSFDGSNDYVSAPSGMTRDNMTLSWWMKPSAVLTIIFMDRDEWDGPTGIEIYLQNSTEILIRGSGSSGNTVTVSDMLADWSYYCITFSDTSALLYQDGIYKGTSTIDQVAASTHNFLIGIYGNEIGLPYVGLVDEIRIYHRVLDVAEIWQQYRDRLAGIYADFPGLNRTAFLGIDSIADRDLVSATHFLVPFYAKGLMPSAIDQAAMQDVSWAYSGVLAETPGAATLIAQERASFRRIHTRIFGRVN